MQNKLKTALLKETTIRSPINALTQIMACFCETFVNNCIPKCLRLSHFNALRLC